MNLLFEPFRPASAGAGSARKIALAVCCLVALLMIAGCSSPESGIEENCIRNGGFTGDPRMADASSPTGIVARQCACFANRMKDTLADDQLKAVAAALERPDHAEALKALPPATVMAIMGATERCARPPT